MGYSKIALKGLSWVAALRFITRIFSFLRIAVIARLLTPSQLGLFGIASVVLAIIEVFTETGINVFLIQEKEKIDRYIHTAWFVSIIRGFFIGGIIIVSASFVASYFSASEATSLLLLIGMVPIIRGFINPAIVTFQKELEFHKEFYFRSIIFFIDSFTVISLVYLTRSTSSLVFGLIVSAIFEVILSFVYVKPTPAVRFNKKDFFYVLSRGKWITFAGIFNYLFHNIDDIIVGKVLGISSLGLYQMGYKVSMLPITEIADVTQKVAFPVFVKISDDIARLRRAFYKMISLVVGTSLPLGFLLFFFPEIIVQIILGDQWVDVVPVLRILAIFGVLRAITGSASGLFLAVKKQEYVTIMTMISLVSLLIFIFPLLSKYDILGAAYASLFAALIVSPLILFYSYKVIYKKNKL